MLGDTHLPKPHNREIGVYFYILVPRNISKIKSMPLAQKI